MINNIWKYTYIFAQTAHHSIVLLLDRCLMWYWAVCILSAEMMSERRGVASGSVEPAHKEGPSLNPVFTDSNQKSQVCIAAARRPPSGRDLCRK